MNIRTDTWHYRVWAFTHFDGKPTQTTLCRYVSRTIFLPIPVAVWWALIIAIILVIFVVGNTVTIALGWGLFMGNGKHEKDQSYAVSSFPPMRLRGYVVPLPAIVLPVYGLILVATLVYLYPYLALRLAGMVLLLLAVFGVMYLLLDGWRRADRWDGWRLFKAYLEAKKGGVCPIVNFKDANRHET